jgi:AraC family transcriptional regulator of adaptative response / DNA-3-methyladenine glycosylase II
LRPINCQLLLAAGERRLNILFENPAVLFTVVQNVRRILDLDSDPLLVANCFQANKKLDAIYNKYPGLRIARVYHPFESAICTILGQLVSVPQGRNLIRQLVHAYGEKVTHPVSKREFFLFPKPAVLAKATLSEVKTTQVRRNTIREVSNLVAKGKLNLETSQDMEAFKKNLLEIPGIGPWTAEYICLRGMGDTDAFPATDLILKRAIENHKDLDLETLRPWRSYAAIYFWQHYAGKLKKQKGNSK